MTKEEASSRTGWRPGRAQHRSHALLRDPTPTGLPFLPGPPEAQGRDADGSEPTAVSLAILCALLRYKTGQDFSQYKTSAMRRAVLNRMAECRIESVEEYTRCLEADPGEPASLATHLFIGVTRFFRDPGAFAALEQHLARLLRTPLTRPVFNVWVPACASGEEAYSIAILFLELLQELLQELPGEARAPCRVSILGTDIDGSAIAVARAGLFHPAIAQHLMPGRLSRFFSRERDGYRVTGEVRSMVDFRVHDVTQRPPPLLFDLISCRNLMIYLMPTLQSTLLSLFHAALYPRGALLLSPSESIGDSIDCYVPLSHVWKLYQAIPSTPVNACNL